MKLRSVWLIVDKKTGTPHWPSNPFKTKRDADAAVGNAGLVIKYTPVQRRSRATARTKRRRHG